MKKAKLWAYLMSGLLTFSTLASDYQIAYAEEAVEADAAGAEDVIEEPKLGEADGFVMQMVGSGTPVEGGEEDSDIPEEPSVTEEGETEGDGSSDKIPVVEGTDGKLIEQEESEEPSESDGVSDGVVADSDTVNKEETLSNPVEVGDSLEKTVDGTVTDVTLSDTAAGSYVISDDKSKVTFTADTAVDNVSMVITYSTVEGETTVEGNTLTVKFSIAEKTTETETGTNEPVSSTARASVDTGKVFMYTLSGGIFTADDIEMSPDNNGSFTVSGEDIYFTAGNEPTAAGEPVVLTVTYKTEKDGNTVEGNKRRIEFTINQAEESDPEPFNQTKNKITASAEAGVFPADTTLVVSSGSETKEHLETLIKVEYGDKYEIVGCNSFEITFKNAYPYEQTVQPKSGTTVNLKFDYTYSGATKYVLFQGNTIAGEGKSIDTATFPQWTIVGIKENTEAEKKIITNGVDGCTVKYSVEWDNKDTTPTPYFGVEGGSAVFHSEYPNDSKKRDLVAGDTIEIPSGVQQSAVDERFTGYHIEWKNYEKKSDIRVHINGFLIGTATVKYIDDATNEVFHTETIENCRWNSTCSVSNTTYPGYSFVEAGSKTSVKILNANAADNVIELHYVKDKQTTYKIERYSGTGDQAKLIPDGSVSVPVSLPGGSDLTVTLTSAQTDFNGYKFKSSDPENGQITISASDTAEKVIKLYYDKLSGYTVQYYLADKEGNYSTAYSSSDTVGNCELGSSQSFDTKENEYKTFNNILYTYEKADPTSASVTITSEEPAENIIKVYYKMFRTVYDVDNKGTKIEARERDGKNEVYFSLIYPYYGIPNVNAQSVSKFYPTNWLNHEPIVQGRWRGTANFLPAGQWNVYDANGINFADYGITMDPDAKEDFDAYLGLFGGPEKVDVIWYNYKCDDKRYADANGKRSAWFVNGIIVQKSGEAFEYVVYDQNYEGGTKRTDNNLPKNDFYTIKGQDGDSMADLTIREGWTFKGWATSSEGPVQYQPGGRVDLATPYHFYAIWERAPISDLVTITAPSKTKVYDGDVLYGSQVTKEEGVTWTGLPDGYSVVNAVTHGSIMNVEEGEIKDDQGYYIPNAFGSEDLGSDGTGSSSAIPYTILDDKENDVTSLFTNVTLISGKLRITPLPLTVTTGSAEKYYDGTPLTCAEADIKRTADGVSVNKEFAIVVATGSVTDVTPKPVTNTYDITWLDVDSSNFSITENLGTLEVKSNPTPPTAKKVTLIAASATRIYNGQELTATSVTAKGLPAGYTYTATATGSITDVGNGVNEVASDYVIYNASHAVATSEFVVETVKGTLTVNPRPVTVKTGSKSKVYDGTPLVCEEASIANLAEGDVVTVKATGTITEVGSTPNTYEIDWGTVNKGNYTVSEELGTLIITETDEEILVTVTGGTYLYDGEAHGPIITVTGAGISYTNDASNGTPIDNLGAGEAAYFVEEASSTTKLIDVSSEAADVNKLVIRNASGADVTSKLKITKDTSNSTVKVVPVPVTITTKSASKVYDGSALTAGGSIDGLVAKDKAEVVFTVTGSQKEVGSSKNTYSLDWGIVSPGNYTVTENIGTLRVTDVDDPTPDDPTGDPDTPSGDPDTPSDDPTPGPTPGPDPNPVVPNITPGTPNPADGVPAIVPTATTTIPDDAVPLAGVLGETRGIEADAASVLGARVPAAQGVLGARRDAQTADSNQMALYLILMGIATGVGGAYISSRRHKRDFLNDLEMMQ